MSGPRRRAIQPLLLGVVLAGSLASGAPAQSPPFSVGGDPLVDPTDFEITVFADTLDAPISMQVLEDGSLLVGTEGGVLRLVDADGDGVADAPGVLLYSGGSGRVTGLRVVGDLVFMARSETIAVLRRGAQPGDALSLETSFDIEIPLPWSHITHTLAVRDQAPGLVELYFNVGSKADAIATTELVPVSGAISGSVAADSIYRVRVDDTGPGVVIMGLEQIAAGVRNSFGIAFHPTTGDLYFQDNSMDGDTEPFELSVDELNVIEAANVGGGVEHFGFPDNYFAYRTNVEVGSGGIDPLLTFQPIPPPNGSESEGAAEIAFAPPGFPAGLNGGLFVGFHGLFASAGLANSDNPLVYVDLSTPRFFHFVENDEPGVGHPDGLVASHDALFVSDFTSVDGFAVPGAGRIYKIRSLAGPPALPLLSGSALMLLALLLCLAGSLRARRH